MKVATGTTPRELARQINRHQGFKAVIRWNHGPYYDFSMGCDSDRFPGFKAVVREQNGYLAAYRPRVYISRYRHIREPNPSNPGDIDESIKTEYTILVEFYLDRPPLLTVKQADMQKGPQFECMMVSDALTMAGIFVNCAATPFYYLSYRDACLFNTNPDARYHFADIHLTRRFAFSKSPDGPRHVINPDSCHPKLRFSVPELGWVEPEGPCACRDCLRYSSYPQGRSIGNRGR